MNNYSLLCQYLDIPLKEFRACGLKSAESSHLVECENGCYDCPNYSAKLPGFTAERQIKMIELLLNRDFSMDLKISYINGKWILLLLAEECLSASNADFGEALADLALQAVKNKLVGSQVIRRVLQ